MPFTLDFGNQRRFYRGRAAILPVIPWRKRSVPICSPRRLASGRCNHLGVTALIIFPASPVGIAQQDIPIVYLVGGSDDLHLCPVDRPYWADKLWQRLEVSSGSADSVVPYQTTHVGDICRCVAWLVAQPPFCCDLRRMIPAMAIIVSSVATQSCAWHLMSLNSTVQSLVDGAWPVSWPVCNFA